MCHALLSLMSPGRTLGTVFVGITEGRRVGTQGKFWRKSYNIGVGRKLMFILI